MEKISLTLKNFQETKCHFFPILEEGSWKEFFINFFLSSGIYVIEFFFFFLRTYFHDFFTLVAFESKCACTCNIGAFFVNFWIFMSHILISSKKKKFTVLWKVNCISWLLVLPYLEFLKSLQAYRFKSKQTQISLYLTIFIRLHNFYIHHVGSVFFCTVTSHP